MKIYETIIYNFGISITDDIWENKEKGTIFTES